MGVRTILGVVSQLQAGVEVESTLVADEYVQAMVAILDDFDAFEAASR